MGPTVGRARVRDASVSVIFAKDAVCGVPYALHEFVDTVGTSAVHFERHPESAESLARRWTGRDESGRYKPELAHAVESREVMLGARHTRWVRDGMGVVAFLMFSRYRFSEETVRESSVPVLLRPGALMHELPDRPPMPEAHRQHRSTSSVTLIDNQPPAIVVHEEIVSCLSTPTPVEHVVQRSTTTPPTTHLAKTLRRPAK